MPPEPRALVEATFAALAARDADALAALIEDGCEFHTPGTRRLAGREGPYVGVEGVREYLDDLARTWATFTVAPQELRVANHGVVAFGLVTGTLLDGTAVEQPVIWVFKLRGGLLRSVRVAETAAQARALVA